MKHTDNICIFFINGESRGRAQIEIPIMISIPQREQKLKNESDF